MDEEQPPTLFNGQELECAILTGTYTQFPATWRHATIVDAVWDETNLFARARVRLDDGVTLQVSISRAEFPQFVVGERASYRVRTPPQGEGYLWWVCFDQLIIGERRVYGVAEEGEEGGLDDSHI